MSNVLPCFFGLFVAMTNRSVPLTGVNYDINVESFASHITINQTYKNTDSTDIECVYGFPINDQASIVGFTVHIDNRTLASTFKKKAEAFKEYTDAISQNNGAYLLDQSERSDDTFVLSVGRLPPGKECTVSISYVSTLESLTETKMRLTIPTSLSPRYNPNPSSPEVGAVAPEIYQSDVPYQATLTGHIKAIDSIQSVSSTTHPLSVRLLRPKEASVEFGTKQHPLDKDLVIEIEVLDISPSFVETELSSPGNYTAMYAFVPKIKQSTINTELIFLVDCSGSMYSENKIGEAKRAMEIFLRSIPEGCYFNFYIFGTSYESLFPKSQLYSSDTFNKAMNYAKTRTADLGGTEILSPLKKIFSDPLIPGFSRQLFVLTDGEVENTNEVIGLVGRNAINTRVFAFGLGDSPSRSLVNGIARAGNGKSEFSKQGEVLEDKIGRHLQRAIQPAVTNISVTWHGVKNVQQVPAKMPSVFKGDRQLVFALFQLEDPPKPAEDMYILLQIGEEKTKIPLTVSSASAMQKPFLSKLAAREMIKQLDIAHDQLNQLESSSSIGGSLQSRYQAGNEQVSNSAKAADKLFEDEVTALSLQYGVLSKYVSLLAVESRDGQGKGNAAQPMNLVEIPVKTLQQSSSSSGYPGSSPYSGTFSSGGGSTNAGMQSSNSLMMMMMQQQNNNNAGRYSFPDASAQLQGSSSVGKADSFGKSPMNSLLDLQLWNGAWNASADLEKLTGISLAEMKRAVAAKRVTLDDMSLATVLAVKFIEEKYPAQANIWQAIVNKANTLLLKQTNAAKITAAGSALLSLIKSK